MTYHLGKNPIRCNLKCCTKTKMLGCKEGSHSIFSLLMHFLVGGMCMSHTFFGDILTSIQSNNSTQIWSGVPQEKVLGPFIFQGNMQRGKQLYQLHLQTSKDFTWMNFNTILQNVLQNVMALKKRRVISLFMF